uniref:Serpin family A member 12 n=1 Tax=Oryctolagus cuniculus TaxID=9986 RepID=A0A5F9CSG7_RABIT
MNLTLGLGLFLAGVLSVKGFLKPSLHGQSYGSVSQAQGWRSKRIAQELARRNMDFGFKLLKKLASSNPGRNIFFSPLSVSTAFSMLCLGAQDSTLAEIKEGFNFREVPERDLHEGFHYLLGRLNQEKRDIKLRVGNSLFIDRRLQPQQKFLRETKNLYDAETVPTDFQNLELAQKKINEYVSEKTQGRISHLIRNIDPGTVMLLTNYIFFRARWLHEFDPKATKQEDFMVSRNRSVQVPMMLRGGLYDVGRDEQLASTVLEMPYEGNITATFILPDEGKLKLLEDGLHVDIFAKWKKLMSRRVVDVSVPKLHIQGTYDLKKTLSHLGITKIFEEHGDLTRIVPHRSLKVGQAVHKAELQMDEKGTEGAAGSGAETLPMETPLSVRMNHPFLMMIYEKVTPSMIFLARVADPSKS